MKPNSTVGVDPSSKTAHITVLPFRDTWYTQEVLTFEPRGTYHPTRAADCFEQAYHYFDSLRSMDVCPSVYIEAPTLVRGAVQSLLTQAYISGVLQSAINSVFPDSVTLVPPSEWKSHVLGKGNGNAGKEKIKEFMVNSMLTMDDNLDQDFYDSGAIALFGLRFAD